MEFLANAVPPEKVKYSGELRVMEQIDENETEVEIWLMRSGVNNNKWDFQNVEKYYKGFVGKPILIAYVHGKIGDGHNMRLVRDRETGEKYYSFMDGTAERIVGVISENEDNVRLVEKDGEQWIVAKGRLFNFYAPELVGKIVRTGRMDVSTETDSKEKHMDGEIEVITAWRALGVTILGDDVAPAIPGANIRALSALQSEFERVKLQAAALANGFTANAGTLKKLPKKGVKKSMNKKAMETLAPKFPGYQIVALSEDGLNVGLVDKNGGAFTYTFNADDGGEVTLSRVKPYHLTATFSFAEDCECAAEVSDIVDYSVKAMQTDTAPAVELQKELDTVKLQLKTMQDAEHTRRLDAVKSAVEKALSDIKACSMEGDADLTETANGIIAKAEDFAKMEVDGKFCGDVSAVEKLMAARGKADTERRLKTLAAQKNAFAWDTYVPNDDGNEDNFIDGLFNRLGN